jgi:magnesium transporter
VGAYLLQERLEVAIALCTSLIAIFISGSALPFIFRYLRLYPVLMSAPAIANVLGVLIYFNLAGVILKF